MALPPGMLPAIEPVSRESTAAVIARQLRDAIMTGTLPPGTQLGETDLAARFQVSRGRSGKPCSISCPKGCCAANGTAACS